jgi:uncharacterized membrane protein YphA (DoxX/SURF4 family)
VSRAKGRAPRSQRKADGERVAAPRTGAARPGQARSGAARAGGARAGRGAQGGAAATGTVPVVPGSRIREASERAGDLAAEWAATVARVVLGLVLAWFGYHELVRPGQWTGYVPVVPPGSSLAIILVLAHGWVLLVLAVALAAGIAPRAAAAVAAVLLLEIVISLTASGGLSDLILRDLGVFGLAVCLTGCRHHRLVLRG